MACKARCTPIATVISDYAIQKMHGLAGGGGRLTKHALCLARHSRLTAISAYVYIYMGGWDKFSGEAVLRRDNWSHPSILRGLERRFKLLKGRDTMCTGTHDFIPANDTIKLELIVQASGQTMENVVYVRNDAGVSESDVRNLATEAIDAWATNIAPIIADAVTLVLVRATDLSSEGSFGFELAPSTVQTGGLNVPILPGNVTVATKFASGLTGRSHRGRAYWIGLTEGQVQANLLAPGFGTNISAAWADFFSDLFTAVGFGEHVVVSYCGGGSWRTSALITPVTNYSTNEDIDSQRRRLNHRGL